MKLRIQIKNKRKIKEILPLPLPPLPTFVVQLSGNTSKGDYQEILTKNYQEIREEEKRNLSLNF